MLNLKNLSALSMFIAAGAAVAQPQLFVIPGQPTDVNNAGTVVVGSNGGVFRWVRVGNAASYTRINEFGGGGGTVVCDSSGAVVVGSVGNTNVDLGPLGFAVAARWTMATGFVEQHSPMVFIGTGSPNTINVQRNVTRDGRYIVGFGYLSAGIGGYRAMLHDTDTNSGVLIPGVSAAGAARILCVSDDATVLAGDDDVTGSAQRPAAWRFNVGTGTYVGQVIEPGTGGITGATVNAMSADGSKLTGRSYLDSNKLVRWVYDAGTDTYTKNILATALTPPGATVTSVNATAMTADGEMIYGTYNNNRGFVWTAATGMVDLTNTLVAEGLTGLPSGNVLVNITNCSDDGSKFVGTGGLGGTTFMVDRTGGVGCVQPTFAPVTSTAQVSMCNRTIFVNASASGTGPFTYQFRKNGVPVVVGPTGNVDVNGVASAYAISSFGNQLQVTNAGPSDAGTYDCVISNACGSVTTPPHEVTAVAPISNDTCATALEASGLGTVTLEPLCGAYLNTPAASCAGTQRADSWVAYTALQDGDYRITNCSQGFDTILSTYDSCGGPQVLCSDNFCSSAASIERVTLAQGQRILIRVATGSSVPSTGIALGFELLPPPPANDTCAGATEITASGAYPWDNTFAGNEGAASCVAASGKDVWFRFVPPANGTLSLNTCGTTLNTVLSIYGGCGVAATACNDNANVTGCTFQSAINNVVVTTGTPVLIRIAANTASGIGSGNLNVVFTAPPCTSDYNGAEGVNGDDLADYIADFFDSTGPQPGFATAIAIPANFAGTATGVFAGFGIPCGAAPNVPQPNPWGAPADAYRVNGYKAGVGQNNLPCTTPNGDDLADFISVFFNGCN